jgi:hypothetical protein
MAPSATFPPRWSESAMVPPAIARRDRAVVLLYLPGWPCTGHGGACVRCRSGYSGLSGRSFRFFVNLGGGCGGWPGLMVS